MDIEIRRGIPDDAQQAVPLVLSAAEPLLTSIFGNGDTQETIAFLTHAWRFGQGQYGCDNHWITIVNGTVAGVVTAWHTKLGAVFDRASLDSVTSFYSLDDAITVLMRNQAYSLGLSPPATNELMLGHVAVSSDMRRTGIGRALIEFIHDHAIQLKKQTLVLDVQLSNISAIRFYQSLNFIEHAINGPFVRFVRPVSFRHSAG